MMAVETAPRKAEFVKRLTRAGYEDFLVLERDTAEQALTHRRLELLDTLSGSEGNVDSITDLAERLNRDVAAVHRDIDTLFEFGPITYQSDGGRKRPQLKHEHVFVEPVM